MAAWTDTLDRCFDQRAVLIMHGSTKSVMMTGAVATPRSRGRLVRALIVLHRWLGVIIGTVMTLWCLSGFVMLFVDYPRLLPTEQLQGLSPLNLPVGDSFRRIALAPNTRLASARLEMVAGRPVLRVQPEQSDGRAIWQTRASPQSYDLGTGTLLKPLSREDLGKVGTTFGHNTGINGPVAAITPISVDQWTVQTFRANRPLYRANYDDAAGSAAYIAGLTGEVVQKTTRFERFWGWLGAVPHWLYPTVLRQNPAAWSQVVIWTSLTGCFLTITGLWIGISRLRRGKNGSFGSPYRGLWWWHHMAGLVFGLITLTWVGSGLFSMNPWGLFDSNAGPAERQRLAGPMRWADMQAALVNISHVPVETVRVETAPLGGKMALAAITADGRTVRIDGSGRPATLTGTDIATALRNGPRVVSLSLLTSGDSYYYAYKEPVSLPVWRAVLADPQATRLYIDAQSGALLRAVDGRRRAERWLWNAPHSFDLPGLRQGPWRYILTLPLLAAVTLVCGTGTWMGIRKLGRDLRRVRRRLLRHPFSLRSRRQS